MPLIIQSKPRQKSKRFEIPLLSYRRLFIPTLQFAKRVSAYPSLFPVLPVDIQPNGVFFIFFITLLLNLQICALCKSALSFSFGGLLLNLGGNGLSASMCNSILIVYSRTCSDLSQPPAFWWLTAQVGGTEYPMTFFLFRGAIKVFCSFSSEKRVPPFSLQLSF